MDASELVKHIQHAADQSPSALKEDERMQLLAACEKLKGTLEGLHTSFYRTSNSAFGHGKL